MKQLLHVTAHHILLQLHQSPSPPQNKHPRRGGFAAAETPWLPGCLLFMEQFKGPHGSGSGRSVCVCVCLLKKQQGKCQTSILQLGKGGGGAALAAHLGNIGWVVFFFFLSIKNCSQASLECQISAVFLRNASSSGQSMESGLAYTWWGHCTRLCVSIPGLVQPDAFQLAFVMGKTCR